MEREVDERAFRAAADLSAAVLPDARRVEDPRCIEFESGGEAGVVLWVCRGAGSGDGDPGSPPVIDVRLPTIVWDGHAPIRTTRLRTSLPASGLTRERLESIVAEAREARRREFRRCRFCGEMVPTERRHDDSCCHGCAERHLGVVH
jgi:hypothetical protein